MQVIIDTIRILRARRGARRKKRTISSKFWGK
jgi:hypothetical protein